MNNIEMKKFIIPGMGHTMGNLVCSYILINNDVIYTGHQVDNDKNLVINIQTSNGLAPDICFERAVKKCQSDIKSALDQIQTQLVTNQKDHTNKN